MTYGTGNTGFKLTAVTAGTAANNTKIVAATGSGTNTAQLTSYVSSSHTYNEVMISFKTGATAADVISASERLDRRLGLVHRRRRFSAGSATGTFAPVRPAARLDRWYGSRCDQSFDRCRHERLQRFGAQTGQRCRLRVRKPRPTRPRVTR